MPSWECQIDSLAAEPVSIWHSCKIPSCSSFLHSSIHRRHSSWGLTHSHKASHSLQDLLIQPVYLSLSQCCTLMDDLCMLYYCTTVMQCWCKVLFFWKCFHPPREEKPPQCWETLWVMGRGQLLLDDIVLHNSSDVTLLSCILRYKTCAIMCLWVFVGEHTHTICMFCTLKPEDTTLWGICKCSHAVMM